MTAVQEPVKSQIRDTAPCQKELAVEVPREAIAAEFEAVYRDMKRTASVPGFRVGHAPRDLLERYHGVKAKEEVIKRLIGHSLEEALSAQGKLDLVGRPRVEQVKFDPQLSLTYTAHLEVAPEVPLARYKKLSLTRPKSQVGDEAVDQVLKRLQETHAELKPVLEPRAAAPGDFLLVDLTQGAAAGKSPVTRRDLLIPLDVENDSEGISRALVGMTPGQKRQVTLKDGKVWTVDLKGIKVKERAALDDSFAKSIGSFDSLQVLKDQIRQTLSAQAQASVRKTLEGEVSHQLLEEWNFDLPPSLVGSQARRLFKERAVELMGQGAAPPERVQEQSQHLAEQAKLDALREVKLFFILRRIASAEKLSVTEEELQTRIEKLGGALRLSAEEVRQELETRDLLDEVIFGIIREKVFDLIIREAQIKEDRQ